MRLDMADRLGRRASARMAWIGDGARAATADPGSCVAIGLIAAWALVVAGLPALLPLQGASWLTFLAVAVTPGYLLGDIVCRRLDLDTLQRLALAFPLSVAVMTPPGLTALLGHLTLAQLALGWELLVALLVVAWGLVRLRTWAAPRAPGTPWTGDERVLLVILVATFVAMFPLLSLYKMDGDAYAVLAFSADALTGEPMNITEPLLGSGYSPNVRMAGNQMLPVFHLWCYLSRADAVQLIGSASRSMLALWALLATYALGREAGDGRRRIGLLAVGIQLLVYLAAPFFRGDSISVFFFERTNADKFTVSVTMLPMTLALALRYVRRGEGAAWLAAALCALAVSAVHALIAAMLALGLASFGALHLALHLRRRVAWRRVIALAGIVAIGMAIPMVQLAMTLDVPLAPTYPSSFGGWPIGERSFQLLPGKEIRGLDLYGPLPDLAELEAADANGDANPFLIWRFAANMRRKRLIIFDVRHYISDPGLVLEPPYLLSLLLLPLLLWRLPSRPGAELTVANALAILFLLFNPLLTPILGALAVPWLLWRFIWLLPYALAIALAADRVLGLVAVAVSRALRRPAAGQAISAWLGLAALGACAILLWPRIVVTSRELRSRPAGPVAYPTPRRLFAELAEETRDVPAMVLADENLSVTIPAFVGHAHILAREVLTSELFPANEQDQALQRHIDQYRFFHSPLLTADSVDVLRRNAVRYVAVSSGADLDLQLRAAPQWFEWLVDDAGYSLYAVRTVPTLTGAIEANTLLSDRQWAEAEARYRSALAQDPDDLLAALGLTEALRLQGRFEPAIETLRATADRTDSAVAHFLLGRLYAERGEWEPAIAALTAAVDGAPLVPRLKVALGSACLADGRIACTEAQFGAAVDARGARDAAWSLITLAGLWDQEGQTERAIALYDRAATEEPDWPTRLLLAGAFQSMGEFDRAEALLRGLLSDNPSSGDARLAMASLLAARGEEEGAAVLLEEALALQTQQLQDTELTHLTLAQILLTAGRPEDARSEIARTLEINPHNAAAYVLLGNLHRDRGEAPEAIAAYHRALEIDPKQVAPYIALSEEYRRTPELAGEITDLLAAGVRENPSSARLHLALSDHQQRQGDVPAAIASCHLAVDLLQPDTILTGVVDRSRIQGRATAYARLAAAYEDQARSDAALSYFRSAAAAAPEARYGVLLGDALRRHNDMPAAAAAYRAAIDRDPTYVDGYTHLAELLQAQGDTAGALSLREQGAKAIAAVAEGESTDAAAGPGRYDLTIQQPGVQRGSDETLALAAAAYSAIQLALDPSGEMGDAAGLTALDGLARLYLDSGEIDLAIRVYQDEIAYGEANDWTPARLARYHASVGSLCLRKEEPAEALPYFRRALALDAQSAAAHVGMGNALTRLGREAEALEMFRRAADLAPGTPEVQLALAAALERGGAGEDALTMYQDVAEAHPGNIPAARALGRAWRTQRRWDAAEETLRRALDVAPGRPETYVDLAAVCAARARYDEAEAMLSSAIRLNRDDLRAQLHLGELMARQGRHPEAMDAYRSALAAAPTDWRPYMGLAETHRALGEADAAVERYGQAATVDGAATAPLLQLASLYVELGQTPGAEAALRSAIERSPGDPTPRLRLADLYQSLGRPGDALETLRLAASECPESVEALLAYADAQRLRGHAAEADALCARAKGVEDIEAPDYRRIATAYISRGRPDQALAWLERAVALWPADPANRIAQGQALAQAGRTAEAIDTLRHATAQSPAEGEVWHLLGTTLLATGRQDEALDALQHAVRVEPTYLPPYGVLVRQYLDLGRMAEAEEVAAAARRIAPGAYQADLFASQVLRYQGRWGEAGAVLEGAAAKAPGAPEPLIAMGELARLQGRTEEAIAWYERAVAVRPGAPAASAALTDLLLHLGENGRALAVARRGVEAAPGSAPLLLRLGRAERALGLFDDAEAIFRSASTADPSTGRPHAELGELHQAQGHIEEAILDYERAAAAEPAIPEYYLALSRLWVSQGRADIALAVLDDGAARAADPAPLRAAASSLAIRQGDAAGALEAVRRGLAEGENAQMLCSLGAYYESQADFARAEEAYQRAVALEPDEPIGHVALADLHLRSGRAREAVAGYRHAVALAPRDPTLHLALGDALRLTGDLAGAAGCYARALELSPTLVEAYCSLGSLYEGQARWAEAEALYEKGLALAPTSGRLLIQYGGLMVQRGEIDRALELLARARQFSAQAETFVARAILYRLLGRAGEAQQDLEAAAQVEPGSVETLVALADLYLARGASGEAAQLYRQAATLAPGTMEGHLGLANLALQQGNLAAAWQEFDAALRAQPGEADPWVQLGQAHTNVEDLAAAESAYRRAVDVAPLVSRAYAGLALVTQRRTGSTSQALAWLDRARALGVDPALVERTTGEIYLRAGQSSQAFTHFSAAARLETVLPSRLVPGESLAPASPEGQLSLASYQLARGLPYAALEAVRAAEAISPRDPAVQLTYGDIYRALGQVPQAEQRYRYAAGLDATRPDGYLALAAMFHAEARYAEAIGAYQQAAARAPLDPTPLIGMGDVYADQGAYEAALQAYGRAAALNPSLPDPWLRRGDALLAQEDVPGAVEAFERAHAIRPYATEPLLRLARMHADQEDWAQAEVYARQAVSADPHDANAHTQLGGILARLERPDEAIASTMTAIQIDPRQVDAYDHWVRLHEDILERPFRIELDRLAAALAAIEEGPNGRTLWGRVLLARGYQRLEGPSDRVKGYLEEAIAVDPAYADLHRQVALLYEQRLEGRPALDAWYRYRYAAALDGDLEEAWAHIDVLQRGRIETPADGSSVSGLVEITGTATRQGFQYYKVECRAIGSEAWNAIGRPSHLLIEHGVLARWDTTGLAPGEYRLRLTVVDETGNYGPQDEITVAIEGEVKHG